MGFAALIVLELQAPVLALEAPSPGVGSPAYMRYLHVGDFRFDPLAETPAIPTSLHYSQVPRGQAFYYIAQFDGPVTPEMKDSLASTGVELLSYINYNAFIVRADGPSIERATALPSIRWIGVFEPAYKLSPRLSDRYGEIVEEATGGRSPPGGVAVGNTDPGAPVASLGDQVKGIDGRGTLPSVGADPSPRLRVVVLAFERDRVGVVARAVAALGGTDITWAYGMSGMVRAEIDRSSLTALAREPGVMWIERETQPYVFNDIARWVIQSGSTTTFATPVYDHGIFGTGQVITVGDTGIDYQHNAFEDPNHATPGPNHRKVTDYYVPTGARGDGSDNGINHGTHVSGTVAGDNGVWHVYDGNPTGSNGTAGPHDGQAFDALLQVQDLSPDGSFIFPPPDLHSMFQDAANRGSSIHTNSWGSCCGDYIAEAAQTDDFLWNNRNFLVLFAAGNSGSGLSSMNPFAVAKNVIAVGATQNGASLENVASFSSRGPASDGRLKPDIMAPGVSIWSAHGCDPGGQCDDYVQFSGTSMATPTAAGAVALVRQYFMDGWSPTGTRRAADGFTPTAALVKGILINGAAEMRGTGAYDNGQTRYPNFNQGWGRILLDDGLFFQQDSRGLIVDDHRTGINTGDRITYKLAIGDGSMPVEITLVWTDFPGVALTNPNLVNDLDLVVTAPDGTVYAGNQFVGFNPGESQRNPTGADHLNNVEAVLVRTGPQTGLWTVSVSGFNVPQGPQPYALVMTGGIAKNKGVVNMDKHRYKSSATVQVTVVDAGLDVNPNAPDTAFADMTSTTETTREVVTLTETGVATSTFVGSIQLRNSPTPVPDGHLQVRNGDTITATYFDANDGLGGSGPTVDKAVVDDIPPLISGIVVTERHFFRATIAWTTDELGDSVLEWGTSIPPGFVKSGSAPVTSHSLTLTGLAEKTTYYYAVRSTDEAGNTARNANGTSFYRFTTPPRPPEALSSPEWPQFHHDRQRGGANPVPFAMPLTQRWSTWTGSRIRWSGTVIDNHTAFFTEQEGTVSAVDIGTGAVTWTMALGDFGYVHGTPATANGNVYVALVTNSGAAITLFALDEQTGAVRWQARANVSAAAALTTPAIDDRNVYWYDGAGKTLRANDALTGATLWTHTMPDRGFQGPTYWAGIVFATDGTGDVLAVDAETGTEFWRISVGAAITSAPTVAGGVLYVGDYAGSLSAIDPLSGNRIWTSGKLGQLVDLSSPVVAQGRVFVGVFATQVGAGQVYALDRATGAVAWSYPLPRSVASSAAYSNGTIFVTAWDGYLYALNASSGTLLQKVLLSPAGSASSVALGDGYLIVGDDSGKLSAFSFVGAGETRRVSTSPSAANVLVANAVPLQARAYDAYDNLVRGATFTWSSVDGLGTVVSASDSGDAATYVAGTLTGTDHVRVTNSSHSSIATVTILPGSLDRIDLTPVSATVVAGRTAQFTAIPRDAFGNDISGTSVRWSVTGSIGSIDGAGRLTAATSPGRGVATATLGTIFASAAVEVVPDSLASITVTPDLIQTAAGTSMALSAAGADRFGNPLRNLTLSWSTTAGTIVPLDAQGLLALYTAPRETGTTTVSARSGTVLMNVRVTIIAGPIATISISPSNPRVVAGGTLALDTSAVDAYGNRVSSVQAQWTTSGGTITSGGVLSAPSESGLVVVTAAAMNRTAETTIIVEPGALDHVAVVPSTLSLRAGREVDLFASAMDRYGNTISGAAFTWSTTIGSIVPSPDGGTARFRAGGANGTGAITVQSANRSAAIDVTVTGGTGASDPLIGVFDQLGATFGVSGSYVLYGLLLALAMSTAILAAKNRRRKRLLKRQRDGRNVVEETIGRNDADRLRGEPEASGRPSDWDWSGRPDR